MLVLRLVLFNKHLVLIPSCTTVLSFGKVGSGSGGHCTETLIGVVSSLAIFVGKPVVERLSPYRLLTIGLIANVFSLGLLSWVMKTSPLAASMNNILVLIILSFFLATQQGLVSPTTWLLLSEMFPQQLKQLSTPLVQP